MRLLEVDESGKFNITDDIVNNPEPYAILSHTWGPDDEEVSFEDLIIDSEQSKAGYRKLRFCTEQTARDGLRYSWVDTCCIDKSNNTELSEAINSMFRWYRNARKCYVYLPDVSTDTPDQMQTWELAFRQSRWFSRGWTLQELIAPRSVEFFSSNGNRLGDKKSLERLLHEITGIALAALRGNEPSAFSPKEKMSWTKNRTTKREEDMAYSLLGIFDIHMPLIYGEGQESAFVRLKEYIGKREKKHQLDELSAAFSINSAKRSKSNAPESQHNLVLRSSHKIDSTTEQSLIDQLHFEKIDERLTSLTAAQGTTCRWFLNMPEYLTWHSVAKQSDHNGFLWIKGHPGTGKSTLMKFLFEEAKRCAKTDSSQIILSFFFLARGTIEEKSTIGLYRSLLHQLFKMAPDLKASLEWMTADGARAIERNGWHEKALKQTLVNAVQKLGGRSLQIFVDALDECDKSQAAGMVCFIEELCDRAREADVRLQICFSSRHYPAIVIQKGLELTLEDQIGHTEDIEEYIKLNFRIGKSRQAGSLRSELLERSSRIFLWVVLVLDILNSEYPNNLFSIKEIRARLKEIPKGLTNLFEMILNRDRDNLEQLQLCLKWILFASRPLKPEELYFAVQFGLDMKSSGYWDLEDVELDQIDTFVKTSSKGLAEITRKSFKVQFIHESVRDFLLGKYEGQWSGSSSNVVGHGHELLRDCCLAQLNASIKEIVLPTLVPSTSSATELRDDINLKFPFLKYSVLNVLYHSNGSQQNGITQTSFLADFPLQRWIVINNILERHDIRRYTETVSLLYIFAEKDLAELIRIHPHRKSCFDVEPERYGPPMFAALATGSYKAVQTFIEVYTDLQPVEHPIHNLHKQYSENRIERAKYGRNFTFSEMRSVLSHVIEQGDVVTLALLFISGLHGRETRDRDSRTPLLLAAYYGKEAVIKFLLDDGAYLESGDNHGRTALSIAALHGNKAALELLLDSGANLKSEDNNGRTALSLAALQGDKAIVELLLAKGADLEHKDSDNRTPLSLATLGRSGNGPVVGLLLAKGAQVESRDNKGRTPLSIAASRRFGKDIIKILIRHGADRKSKDNNGRTPLSLADPSVVSLLRSYSG